MSENVKKLVWIDTDPALGDKNGDPDDGYAMIALLRCPSLDIRGISAVFANTDVTNAYGKTRHLIGTYHADRQIPIYKGANDPLRLNVHKKEEPDVELRTTEASGALAAQLANLADSQRLTIVAIGALTNVATVLLLHPELASKIESVVVVAGRNSEHQPFVFGTEGSAFRDLNFDVDPDSFRVLLQSAVETIVFAGVEVSRHMLLEQSDLDRFIAAGEPDIRFVAEQSMDWLKLWKGFGNQVDNNGKPILVDGRQVPVTGFHPFDLLAASYVINPSWLLGEKRPAGLRVARDETQAGGFLAFKNYLVAAQEVVSEKEVIYLTSVSEGYSEAIKRLLLGNPAD